MSRHGWNDHGEYLAMIECISHVQMDQHIWNAASISVTGHVSGPRVSRAN